MIKDGMKLCPRCKELKEFSEFGKDKHTKTGLACRCKSCMNIIATNNRYKKNPNRKKRENLVKDGTKKCLGCNEWKEFSEFSNDKSTKDSLVYYCKSCINIITTNIRDKTTQNKKRVKKVRRDCYDIFGNGKDIIYGPNKEIFLVDKEDYEILIKYKWGTTKKGYALTTIKSKTITMHRFIMKAKKGEMVDHINGNKLDNRKCNLRICNNSQNLSHRVKLNKRNKSGKTGVHWNKEKNKWIAVLQINKKYKFLGYFDDLEKAIEARIKAEEKYFGEFKPII